MIKSAWKSLFAPNCPKSIENIVGNVRRMHFWQKMTYFNEKVHISSKNAKMPPNSEIEVHTDTHPYFGESHRLHWCLKGEYEKMDFLIAGNKIPMYEGDLIEINNRMPHSVVYRGETPRYNLIIDFMLH